MNIFKNVYDYAATFVKSGFNWFKTTETHQASDGDLSSAAPSPQSADMVKNATNKLKELSTAAMNVAGGLVTGVVSAAKEAATIVKGGFDAVTQKATEIVTKVQDHVATKAVSNALQKFKTWVSENKGLFTAALVAVLALIFLPFSGALGGLFRSNRKHVSADRGEDSTSMLKGHLGFDECANDECIAQILAAETGQNQQQAPTPTPVPSNTKVLETGTAGLTNAKSVGYR